jgi:glucan biosynthesis protein C
VHRAASSQVLPVRPDARPRPAIGRGERDAEASKLRESSSTVGRSGGSGGRGPLNGGVTVGPSEALTSSDPSIPSRTVPRYERRAELDLMRAFVVAGLVVFHSAVVFAAGTSWFVNDPNPSFGFSILLAWGSLWGMPLLFLVSGMGVRYALRHRSASAFLRERLARLLVPFVTGVVLLVPPMFYLDRLNEPGFHESYWHFWIRFLDVPAIAGGLLSQGSWREFDPAHVWFLYVLVLWSIVLFPLFLYLRRPARKGLVDRAAGLAERNLAVVLFGAAVPIVLVEAVLGPDVDTGGWERLAYLFFLLYGYVIASDARFEGVLRRARRFGLALGLVATVGLVVWAAALSDSTAFRNGGVPGLSALQALAGWLWIVAIVGFAGSFVAGRSGRPAARVGSQSAGSERRAQRTARYANEAVLPFYLLHEPVIVAAAWIIIRWDVPIVVKYAALVIVSLVGTLALYEGIVRRFRVSRFLFGMKVAPKSAGRAPGVQ